MLFAKIRILPFGIASPPRELTTCGTCFALAFLDISVVVPQFRRKWQEKHHPMAQPKISAKNFGLDGYSIKSFFVVCVAMFFILLLGSSFARLNLAGFPTDFVQRTSYSRLPSHLDVVSQMLLCVSCSQVSILSEFRRL